TALLFETEALTVSEIRMLSLIISANSRKFPAFFANVTVAEARVVGGGLADGSQFARLPASPHFHVEPRGSIIICPNRPVRCWNSGSDGNRLSEPNSTGVWVSFPVLALSIFPAYH